VGRDSVVSIGACYGTDGPGIESRWGRNIPHPSRQTLVPNQPPVQWAPGVFPRIKRSGRGAEHPIPSGAEVKERVDLNHYSPSRPSWPGTGLTSPLL
jgi:hypothetical protein